MQDLIALFNLFNLLVPNAPFLHPFQGAEKGYIENRWVKQQLGFISMFITSVTKNYESHIR